MVEMRFERLHWTCGTFLWRRFWQRSRSRPEWLFRMNHLCWKSFRKRVSKWTMLHWTIVWHDFLPAIRSCTRGQEILSFWNVNPDRSRSAVLCGIKLPQNPWSGLLCMKWTAWAVWLPIPMDSLVFRCLYRRAVMVLPFVCKRLISVMRAICSQFRCWSETQSW